MKLEKFHSVTNSTPPEVTEKVEKWMDKMEYQVMINKLEERIEKLIDALMRTRKNRDYYKRLYLREKGRNNKKPIFNFKK